jgi:two-component system NtrC family sensor kinase
MRKNKSFKLPLYRKFNNLTIDILMDKLKSFFQSKSIRGRLIFWFLLLSLLPLACLSIILYQYSKIILFHETGHVLKAVSGRQSRLIENYFLDKQKTTVALGKEVISADLIKKLTETLNRYGKNSESYKLLEKEEMSLLSAQTSLLDYSNLLLVTNKGQVVYSTSPSNLFAIGSNISELKETRLDESFKTAKTLLTTQLLSLKGASPEEPSTLFITTPLFREGELIGFILAQLNNAIIENMFIDYVRPRKTGEMILIKSINGSIFTQTPLRKNKKNHPDAITVLNGSFGLFAERVLAGEIAVVRTTDYNGDEVFATGHNLLSHLGWGVITKIDVNEAVAPIKRLKMLFYIIISAIGLTVILIAANLANNIARPILNLTRKTRLMSEGDLSQRIAIAGDDEIGHLSSSFNEMANQLDHMINNLDTIVAKRTEEVELKNNELEYTVEELKQTQSRLINQEKLASLGALTAGIAHEIKNPLNFINNFAELSLQICQDINKLKEDMKKHIDPEKIILLEEFSNTLQLNIDRIYEHGKKADGIVHNMLRHSNANAGEMALSDVNALLEEHIKLSYHGMRAQDTSFNVKIVREFDASIPNIFLVPQDMGRVFLNLLNNAYYSVNHKKKRLMDNYSPVVKISTFYKNNLVIIKIWDNGEGIPDSVFPKLFTPFYSTKPSGEGTGLGLSLSYNIIVQGHQGTITANSEYGEFAEFIITIPMREKKEGGSH